MLKPIICGLMLGWLFGTALADKNWQAAVGSLLFTIWPIDTERRK